MIFITSLVLLLKLKHDRIVFLKIILSSSLVKKVKDGERECERERINYFNAFCSFYSLNALSAALIAICLIFVCHLSCLGIGQCIYEQCVYLLKWERFQF